MANSAFGKIRVFIDCVEGTPSTNTGGPGTFPHTLDHIKEIKSGTSATLVVGGREVQFDRVYSAETTMTAGTPVDLDLRGGLVSALDGSALPIVKLCGIVVLHETTGKTVKMGASVANGIAGVFNNLNDALLIGPGMPNMWWNLDGVETTAGSADILTFEPSAGSIDVRVWLFGRSA